MGRRKLTRILLEAGGSIEIKNAQNETPRDIALRKNLPEILEILDSPVIVKTPKDRDRSSSNSKSADKVGGNKSKSKNQTDYVVNPANWSPYGCHYFPDPRSFPSPKLETLPKEPLGKGEQYYLDLAGNIRKGPIGVGNTCYCGPFFRHIEERISRNRKSIRKYVHKATERLDNKVQALALKTDDQIEQLTRSMIADRIRCEGRRIHLEQWLKRGDPTRITVGHHLKSKKNLDNTNTLTRCKSLELLDETSLDDKKIQNSRSFDILDGADVIVHRGENDEPVHSAHDSVEHQRRAPSQVSSDRKTSKNSDRSRSSGGRLECDNYSVSERLEELLAKTNEILELEKISRRKKKQVSHNTYTPVAENVKKRTKVPKELKVSPQNRHSMYTEDIIEQLKKTSLAEEKRFSSKNVNDVFIEKEMKKITTSLLHEEESENEEDEIIKGNLPPLSPEIIKEFPSQKEIERRSDQEHEKSSILSGSSQKNPPSSSGSGGYVPEFSHNLRLRNRKHSDPNTIDKTLNSPTKKQASPIDEINYQHKDYQYLLNALRNGYNSQEIGLPLNNENYHQDQFDPTRSGFYQNSTFDDTFKSEKSRNLSLSEKSNPDQEDTVELSEMANVKEINELKSRILNGSNWKSQVLKKTQQQANKNTSSDNKDAAKNTNGSVQKLEIKNSEIKTLKSPQSGILKRSKVQELVAKIQGKKKTGNNNEESTKTSQTNSSVDNKVNRNDDHNENSESSEDEEEHHRESNHPEQIIYVNKPIEDQYYLQQRQHHYVPGEDHYYYNNAINRAQPQVGPSLFAKPIYHHQTNNIVNSQHLANLQKQFLQKPIIDARNLVPKDAYFHELPNKNRLRPIIDKLPEKQMINFSHQFQQQLQTPSPPVINLSHHQTGSSGQPSPNSANSLVAARTRNPLPYLQGYDENYVQISPSPNSNRNLTSPSFNSNRHIPYPEKLLSNRKFITSNGENYVNTNSQDSIDYGFTTHNPQQMMHSSTTTILQHHHHQSSSITPDQAQIERDSNNDSGYSTKIGGGSSHGPSPSLSGSTGTGCGGGGGNEFCGPTTINSNDILTNIQKEQKHSENNGNVTYFVGNIGASSLV